MMDKRSEKNLQGVHPDLVRVARGAWELATPRFVVTEGLRTLERQKQLVRAGASRTLNSRHLTGHAFDIVFIINGTARWDWPLYDNAARVIKAFGERIGVPIEWGGDWPTFRDGPHFQLPFKEYPVDGR